MSDAGDIAVEYGELLTLHDRLRAAGEEQAASHVHTAAEWLEKALRAMGHRAGAWVGGDRDAEPSDELELEGQPASAP